jgi:glycosyltransferase involved in cell wall biosynthesis
MKILVVAPQPFYSLRGTPIAVRQIVETLCSAGHDVHLLVYHAGEDIQIPGMTLFRAGRPPGVGSVPIGISVQKLACDVYLISRMIRLMRRHRYDVVHAVEEAIFPAALLTPFFPEGRLIYDMDSSLSDQLTDKWRVLKPLRALFERLERSVVRRSAATLAVCEDLACKVRPWTEKDRVIVLPDVAAWDHASVAQVESLRDLAAGDDVLGLYVGNLEAYQGTDLMLEALALVPPDQPFRLVVIGGDDEHIASYRRRAERLGITNRVRFVGKRPLEHLPSYLAQADVLISPRRLGTNTPMKIYSYMHAGKAILATNIRSHTQVLDDRCAYLTEPTAQSLADGMVRLCGDAELRTRLGIAAAVQSAGHCSPESFRQRLLAAYARLLPPSAICMAVDMLDLSYLLG